MVQNDGFAVINNDDAMLDSTWLGIRYWVYPGISVSAKYYWSNYHASNDATPQSFSKLIIMTGVTL